MRAMVEPMLSFTVSPTIIQEADSDATALNLVAVGMGVSFVVAATSPLPDVVLKPVAELDHALTLALVWNAATQSPLIANFVDTVRTVWDREPAARSS